MTHRDCGQDLDCNSDLVLSLSDEEIRIAQKLDTELCLALSPRSQLQYTVWYSSVLEIIKFDLIFNNKRAVKDIIFIFRIHAVCVNVNLLKKLLDLEMTLT